MITIESREGTENYIKAWCETCATILRIEEAAKGKELTHLQEEVTNFEASRHERFHPQHSITVTTYNVGNNRVA